MGGFRLCPIHIVGKGGTGAEQRFYQFWRRRVRGGLRGELWYCSEEKVSKVGIWSFLSWSYIKILSWLESACDSDLKSRTFRFPTKTGEESESCFEAQRVREKTGENRRQTWLMHCKDQRSSNLLPQVWDWESKDGKRGLDLDLEGWWQLRLQSALRGAGLNWGSPSCKRGSRPCRHDKSYYLCSDSTWNR